MSLERTTRLERLDLVSADEKAKRERLILDQVLAGNREAFAEIVRGYQNELFSKIYRWVRDASRAEDMTQETFIKAFKELKSFRGEAKLSTWLFQIALNGCRDFWRAQKRRPAGWTDPDRISELTGRGPSPEQSLAQKEEAAKLRRALGEVPEKYRETLLLRFMEDLSCQEIAAATGQGISNVKMRLMRGLEELRQRLTEEEMR